MNALLIALGLCLVMFLYPPTGVPTEYGKLGRIEYMPIWEATGDRNVDYFRLLIQFGFVLVPAYFIGFYGKRDEPRPL